MKIQPGIDQNRNYDREGSWTRQWVRGLPPENLPHLVIVQGPVAWLAESGRPESVAEVAARNEEHVEVFRAAMVEQDLLNADAVTVAGRVVSVLRPVEVEGQAPATRHARLWLLWEVLADAVHADMLSAAIAAVQTLTRLDVEVRLARYPSEGSSECYGLLVPDTAATARPWAIPVATSALLPLALSAKPVADLRPEDVVSWSWAEVLAADWVPSVSPRRPGETTAATVVLESEISPDLCSQALTLGFECVSADPREAREATLIAVSGAISLLIVSWLALVYRQRLQRLKRAELLREEREKRGF